MSADCAAGVKAISYFGPVLSRNMFKIVPQQLLWVAVSKQGGNHHERHWERENP